MSISGLLETESALTISAMSQHGAMSKSLFHAARRRGGYRPATQRKRKQRKGNDGKQQREVASRRRSEGAERYGGALGIARTYKHTEQETPK